MIMMIHIGTRSEKLIIKLQTWRYQTLSFFSGLFKESDTFKSLGEFPGHYRILLNAFHKV